mmetsp:Transcript_7114/g.18110  ORF Transcript_7114/g.18110 Transcript_7114/m.18110 type:complete len:448 (-) Transcript_7114:2441-3784(-)
MVRRASHAGGLGGVFVFVLTSIALATGTTTTTGIATPLNGTSVDNTSHVEPPAPGSTSFPSSTAPPAAPSTSDNSLGDGGGGGGGRQPPPSLPTHGSQAGWNDPWAFVGKVADNHTNHTDSFGGGGGGGGGGGDGQPPPSFPPHGGSRSSSWWDNPWAFAGRASQSQGVDLTLQRLANGFMATNVGDGTFHGFIPDPPADGVNNADVAANNNVHVAHMFPSGPAAKKQKGAAYLDDIVRSDAAKSLADVIKAQARANEQYDNKGKGPVRDELPDDIPRGPFKHVGAARQALEDYALTHVDGVFNIITTSHKPPTGVSGHKHTFSCHCYQKSDVPSQAVERASGSMAVGTGCNWTVHLVEAKEGYYVMYGKFVHNHDMAAAVGAETNAHASMRFVPSKVGRVQSKLDGMREDGCGRYQRVFGVPGWQHENPCHVDEGGHSQRNAQHGD